MRYLGIDFGGRGIGLALSDASGTLARPWITLPAADSPARSAERVATRLATWMAETGEAVAAVVVGLPRKLSGDDTDLTPAVRAFAARVGAESGLAVYLQDERLTSHEADERLKVRERDWRARKKQIDAAAAAIILQDFLDMPRVGHEGTTAS